MNMNDNFNKCVEVAAEALRNKGFTTLDASAQVKNIFGYAASDPDFKKVCESDDNRVQAELRAQIKYICEMGLDTAKGRKLVYVRTRGLNIGTRENKKWLTMPDISESYHALIHVLVRSDALKNVSVIHTYQNYPIVHSGLISDVPVVKSWEVTPDERGTYTGLFVVLTLSDGEIITSYHHAADIFATHRRFTKSENTWKTHELAMCAKSAILDAVRYIPIFDSTVAAMVEHYDQSMDWDRPVEAERITEEQALQLHSMLTDNNISVERFEKWLKSAWKCDGIDSIHAANFKAAKEQIQASIDRKKVKA